ncbi:MAG: putative lipid II flippase FtsW [Patescibacteria group bacterium]
MRGSTYKTHTTDLVFIVIVLLLTIFGLVMLTSASSDLSKAKFGDSYYYLKHQIMFGLIPGIVGFFLAFFIPLKYWEKFALPFLILSVICLILVFTPFGLEIKGSERWLSFGFFSFQPGELMKFTFILFLASWVSRNQARSKTVTKGLLPFLLFLGVVLGLLVMQPSTTIAVIIFLTSLISYITAGARARFIAVTLLLAVVMFVGLILVTPYRMERVKTFFDGGSDPLGATYHINQAQQAIGSGQLDGVGFGKSTTKLKYLPEPIGDSIFAVIAEEFGFIGSMAVLLGFLVFLGRGFMIARRSPDSFSKILTTGFVSLIGIQAFINIGAISGLLPLTGVPLPFVSYGGTALAVFLTMSGIIGNISRYRR